MTSYNLEYQVWFNSARQSEYSLIIYLKEVSYTSYYNSV